MDQNPYLTPHAESGPIAPTRPATPQALAKLFLVPLTIVAITGGCVVCGALLRLWLFGL